jgi:hypothetical protein
MRIGLPFLVIFCVTLTSFAADETVCAVRVNPAPVVDGVISDGEYPCGPATGFRQYRPSLGEPAANDTEVYIVYDDEAFYLAWICYEDNVDGLVGNAMVRDSFLNPDDCIDLMLDANNDRQSAYDFMVNYRGVMYDGEISRDGEAGGPGWDGVWEAKTSVGEDRWFCEMKIPWSSIVHEAGNGSMGIQLMRCEIPGHEDTYWASDGRYLNRVSTFGTVTGFDGIKGPKRFTFIPYGTVRGYQLPTDETYSAYEKELKPDAGIDFGLRGGKPFQLNLTLNPDYAHIEADPEEIVLNPEEIYLEEKRPFFTEAQSMFGTDYTLLYTRKLNEVLAGGKITGTAGPVSYGGLDVQLEDDDPRFPGDNAAAARVITTVYEASTVGGAIMHREGAGPTLGEYDTADSNTVAEADADLKFFGGWKMTGQFLKSFTDGAGGDGYVYTFRTYHPSPTNYVNIAYNEVSDDFEHELGFMQLFERNKREFWVYGQKDIQVYRGPIRSLWANAFYTHWWRIDDGEPIDHYVEPYFEVRFINDMFAGVFAGYGYDDRFYAYGFDRQDTAYLGVSGGVKRVSWGSIDTRYWHGEVFGETYNTYIANVTLIPVSILQVTTGLEVNDPAEGSPFAAINFKLTHNIKQNLFWRAIVQSNTQDHTHLGSFLVGWEYVPGSRLYAAYEERRDNTSGNMDVLDRRVFAKISYMLSV